MSEKSGLLKLVERAFERENFAGVTLPLLGIVETIARAAAGDPRVGEKNFAAQQAERLQAQNRQRREYDLVRQRLELQRRRLDELIARHGAARREPTKPTTQPARPGWEMPMLPEWRPPRQIYAI